MEVTHNGLIFRNSQRNFGLLYFEVVVPAELVPVVTTNANMPCPNDHISGEWRNYDTYCPRCGVHKSSPEITRPQFIILPGVKYHDPQTLADGSMILRFELAQGSQKLQIIAGPRGVIARVTWDKEMPMELFIC
ncbi:TPA: hypothetical protein DF272_03125 [Candidatus Falkowbacteria bacterium]|nr:hypothetical protein [Candidatus Falkowbacteria bacterium]